MISLSGFSLEKNGETDHYSHLKKKKKKKKKKTIAQAILHGSDGIFLISRCVMITSVSAAKVKVQSTTAHQTFIKL